LLKMIFTWLLLFWSLEMTNSKCTSTNMPRLRNHYHTLPITI
jgi:hypothetical protein